MSDEIVARLRAVPTKGNGMCCGSNSTIPNPYYSRCQDAADEIERLRELMFNDIYFGQLKLDEVEYLQAENERLRSAISKIEQAIVDEGKMPSYHRAVMKRHRMEWGTLHNAIDKAIEALHG